MDRSEPAPSRFFEVLRECGALKVIFPEVDRLFGVPQPEEHHPEVDTGVHTLMVLEQAARLSRDIEVRFAALVHDLGKGVTPKSEWPRHIGHETSGVPLVQDVCARLKVPTACRDLAILVTRYHLHYHRAGEMRASSMLEVFQKLDAFRRPQRFVQWLLACEADSRGRPGHEDHRPRQSDIFEAVFEAAREVEASDFITPEMQGRDVADELARQRIQRIRQAQSGLK